MMLRLFVGFQPSPRQDRDKRWNDRGRNENKFLI